jgi:pyruvate dehydrogenase E2 component (dihydrolipoamide acetyltransferase)
MDVVLPKNSLTMTEAEILEWHVQEGAEVTAGTPLFVMETEKSQVEVEATASGTLVEIRHHEGSIVSAGEVVAIIDTAADPATPASSLPDGAALAPSIAPAAVALARHLGIDTAAVRGSGTGGRVLEEDIMRAAKQAAAANTPQAHYFSRPVSRPATPSRARASGNRATLSSRNVPTFYLACTVPLSAASRPDGATASDLLIVAAAKAARRVPLANAYADGDEVRIYDDVRIGLLVRDEDALIPLVFADPDLGQLADLHAQRRQLTAAPRVLAVEATSWPTLVVSNIGRPRVRWFTAVLYPGTSVTVAVGGRGAIDSDRAEVVLTCDHRVVDGVDAADFATALCDALHEIQHDCEER